MLKGDGEISHLKCIGQDKGEQLTKALDLIEVAVERGVEIGFDVYPYTAASTYLSGYMPTWLSEGDWATMEKRLEDPATVQRLQTEISEFLVGRRPDQVMIMSVASEANQSVVGKTVAEVAEEREMPLIPCLVELLRQEMNQVMVLVFAMRDEDVNRVLAHRLAAVASDSLALTDCRESDRGGTHPRSYGTFARVLGQCVRNKALLSLEEAVRKMSSLPAQRLGLPDRGLITETLAADLVVFNADKIIDKATYQRPCQNPEGIEYVIVNGQVVVEGNRHTGCQPGQVLIPGRSCI